MAEQAWQKISEFKGIAIEAILNEAYNFFFFSREEKEPNHQWVEYKGWDNFKTT